MNVKTFRLEKQKEGFTLLNYICDLPDRILLSLTSLKNNPVLIS